MCGPAPHQMDDLACGGHGRPVTPLEAPAELSHAAICVGLIGRSVHELTSVSARWKSECSAPEVRYWKAANISASSPSPTHMLGDVSAASMPLAQSRHCWSDDATLSGLK